MKILVADDEKIVRDNLGAILKAGGKFEVDYAANGEEAFQKFMADGLDAILLDLEMPGLNGYEVLKKIRAVNPSLPVVLITGKATPDKVTQSILVDKLNAFIEKPFTPESVLEVVNRVLAKKKG